MAVFVLDKHQKPLMPASEKRARLLLSRGKAVVHKRYPFTIRLKERVGGELQPLRLKFDPGSKQTGVALVRESETLDQTSGEIKKIAHIRQLFEIQHRGRAISKSLLSRGSKRRRRRGCNLRYREARYNNRVKPKGWLAPSLQHRVDAIENFVKKMVRLAPIAALSMELVRFDMQAMQNPDIKGIEYQQGTLYGYEMREYLLEKFGRECVYCDEKNQPLQVEHIDAKVNGGSNRLSNLTIACECCNQKKGKQPIEVFLKDQPERLKRIKVLAKAPLNDAAAVNSTRWVLFNTLKVIGLTVEVASGGRTKYNRCRLAIPKAHALDAACVGDVDSVADWNVPTLAITCRGRGQYQRTLSDQYGFPRGFLPKTKMTQGFQTGDMVKATVTKGKKIGTYTGRVAVRSSGYFNIATNNGTIQGISHRYCQVIARNDGYGYRFQPKIAS
ncbi:MAG: RNA-guided endonuclease IscB [Methylobacter sp.]